MDLQMNEALHKRRTALAAALLLAAVIFVASVGGDLFTLAQVQTQDLPVLLALPLFLVGSLLWLPARSVPAHLPSRRILLASGAALALLLGWGSHLLMGDFPLSRDEHMVVFDMAVFAQGRLAAPLDSQWQDFAEALVPAFLLNADAPHGLVSDYLPVNAMLRLAFSFITDPAFFNPALVLIGGIALVCIASRCFGTDARPVCVVLLVYILSTQMLVTAMTTYAMTAHMALNLVWLAAFLHGRKAGHVLAIVTAFLAIGLHQFVFHLLFATPFLLWRLRQGGQRRLVLGYAVAYGAILAWWWIYPTIAMRETGIPAIAAGTSDDLFVAKILPLVLDRNPNTIPLMLLNLMRFVAWQNLALIPLMIAALPLAWRGRSLAGPLFWGIGGLLLFVTLILPYQGHGWGYRYLHPFLGSFALLAAFGYRRLTEQIGPKADGMVLLLSAATLVLAIPTLLTRTYGFVAPHIRLEQAMEQRRGDFLLIDTEDLPSRDGRWSANAIDHVRNLPNLSNRPLRFSSRHLDDHMIKTLCRRGNIGLVTRAEMRSAGFGLNAAPRSARFERLSEMIRSQGCLSKS